MSPARQPPLSLVRRLVVANLNRPATDVIDGALACLVEALDARAAFLGKIDDEALEIVAAVVESGPSIERGLRICLLYTSPSPRDLSTSRMPSSA